MTKQVEIIASVIAQAISLAEVDGIPVDPVDGASGAVQALAASGYVIVSGEEFFSKTGSIEASAAAARAQRLAALQGMPDEAKLIYNMLKRRASAAYDIWQGLKGYGHTDAEDWRGIAEAISDIVCDVEYRNHAAESTEITDCE